RRRCPRRPWQRRKRRIRGLPRARRTRRRRKTAGPGLEAAPPAGGLLSFGRVEETGSRRSEASTTVSSLVTAAAVKGQEEDEGAPLPPLLSRGRGREKGSICSAPCTRW
ncbi:unnamed protein product, partial [Ectocarpus sp. 12 AP-2014]